MIFWQEPVPSNSQATESHDGLQQVSTFLPFTSPIPELKQRHANTMCQNSWSVPVAHLLSPAADPKQMCDEATNGQSRTCMNATQPPQSVSDSHTRAQYLSPVVVRRAHSGVALSPVGTSLGQLPWLSHLGLQKSPDRPCTRTACSSVSQPVFGSP